METSLYTKELLESGKKGEQIENHDLQIAMLQDIRRLANKVCELERLLSIRQQKGL